MSSGHNTKGGLNGRFNHADPTENNCSFSLLFSSNGFLKYATNYKLEASSKDGMLIIKKRRNEVSCGLPKDMFTLKPLGHGSWESLRVLWALTLGLHEGSFGLQSITSSLNENPTWNPTWQVWITMVGIVKIVFGITLESRLDEICGGN